MKYDNFTFEDNRPAEISQEAARDLLEACKDLLDIVLYIERVGCAPDGAYSRIEKDTAAIAKASNQPGG